MREKPKKWISFDSFLLLLCQIVFKSLEYWLNPLTILCVMSKVCGWLCVCMSLYVQLHNKHKYMME